VGYAVLHNPRHREVSVEPAAPLLLVRHFALAVPRRASSGARHRRRASGAWSGARAGPWRPKPAGG
jgi:hypothetical protein